MSKIDAAKFILQCQNWPEVALPIATHKIPARVILKNGTRFVSPSAYWADMHAIFFQGIYTPLYLPIEKNDLVVDIGANIGVFSLYAARRTRNMVYALEPSPANFSAIEQNIRANQLKNVLPLRYAISDTSGTEMFFTDGQSQHHRLTRVLHETPPASIAVSTITLKDLMDEYQIPAIDFLKLDCEGAEEPVFLSTPTAYLQRVRKLAMEFHDHLTKLQHDELKSFLEALGFTTRIYWDGKSVLGFIYAWRR